jgi:hypothetical protein
MIKSLKSAAFVLVIILGWPFKGLAQTNAVHNWLLKTGAAFPGDFVSSGSQMVVIKNHGTNYFLKISDLSTNDWLYFYECKTNQRQMQLDAEAAQFQNTGMIEFTAKLIEHFPEKVLPYQKGWMDVTFNDLSQSEVEVPEMEIGLFVTDQNGDSFFRATIFKQLNRPELDTAAVPNPLANAVLNFKRGDKIRLIGHCYPKFSDSIHEIAGTPDKAGFLVEQIEMIEPAAEAEAVKKVKEDLENGQWQNVFNVIPLPKAKP